MAHRLTRDTFELIVYDQLGRPWHHYNFAGGVLDVAPGNRNRGAIIEWLDDAQRDRLLAGGLIEEVPEPTHHHRAPAATASQDCVAQLKNRQTETARST